MWARNIIGSLSMGLCESLKYERSQEEQVPGDMAWFINLSNDSDAEGKITMEKAVGDVKGGVVNKHTSD